VGARGPKPSQPCGTVAAYKRHRRAGEDPCAACAAAWATKQREMYAARKERTGRKERDATRGK